jgi:hypothetical protein
VWTEKTHTHTVDLGALLGDIAQDTTRDTAARDTARDTETLDGEASRDSQVRAREGGSREEGVRTERDEVLGRWRQTSFGRCLFTRSLLTLLGLFRHDIRSLDAQPGELDRSAFLRLFWHY